MSQENLRRLDAADLQGALELSRLANWNQTIDDWKMLLQLDPEGCFAIVLDSQIVATTTLLCYGKRLAWDWDGADQARVPAPRARQTTHASSS